jgi:hypothetical protein
MDKVVSMFPSFLRFLDIFPVKAKLVIGRFGTSPCSGPGTGHLRVQITSDCEKGLVRIKSVIVRIKVKQGTNIAT